MANCIIIIPIYKEIKNLNLYEITSIKQTLLVFGKTNQIFLVTHEQDLINTYNKYFNYLFMSVLFPHKYFKSTDTYNTLLKSIGFYNKFKSYDYMLIVQPDVFVFRNEIKKFIDNEIDYIGAPWFKSPIFPNKIEMLVGNGGYSLRHIYKCIGILKSYKRIFSLPELVYAVRKYQFKGSINNYLVYIYSLYYYLFQNYFASGFNNLPFLYEDVFWGILTPSKHKEFIVPDAKEALKFSFETKPSLCFELNNDELPTGCHAFHKNEPEFWRKYISTDNN